MSEFTLTFTHIRIHTIMVMRHPCTDFYYLSSQVQHVFLGKYSDEPKQINMDIRREIKGFLHPGRSSPRPMIPTLRRSPMRGATRPKTPRQWLYATALEPAIFVSLTPNKCPRSPRLFSDTSLHLRERHHLPIKCELPSWSYPHNDR